MFNLLPDILKEKLKAEYKRRWLTVVFMFVIFLQVSFLIFLFPTWVLSLSKEQDITSNISATNRSTSSKDATPIASIIADTNTKLNIINTAMEYQKVLPLVNIIIGNKIPSIHIKRISYEFTDKSDTTINLGGLSDTREGLVSFVKNLESSRTFKSIDLPVSNFTKGKDIDFSLSMTVLK